MFFLTNQKFQYFNRQLLLLAFLFWDLNQFRLSFLYQKKFYKNSETETALKSRTNQKLIEYGTMQQICLCFSNSQRLTKFTIEKLKKFCSRKSLLSIYLIFFQVGHFFSEILQDYFTFPILQFIEVVPWFNLIWFSNSCRLSGPST